MVKATPYIGQLPVDGGKSVPTYYVSKLSEPNHDTPRNTTCDKWFTSIELFSQMKKNHGLTMVGTIRKKKREIPHSLKCISSIGTTRYGYSEDNILLSFCPKVVLMSSSKHKTRKQCADSDKPEMIVFYNVGKIMINCARNTGVFEEACISYNLRKEDDSLDSRAFLKNLALSLTKLTRAHDTAWNSSIAINICEVLLTNDANRPGVEVGSNKLKKGKRYFFP
ncbi:unnamed protein product [Hermetia illucens]|uniref:PiggyBac transposable element-derived protein domain-containing protein n=1 Tax=Hermetia illucens TaxID=343691 RepID=A0A7R8UWT6_HERIL|nr:uncharacterized protein LOC119653997 [Hermetia illucens]CAD7088079.1 unnamed protein product [Hermetia illucens]